MLIYTEHNDPEMPTADIHNVDTGITYSIEMLVFHDGNTPVVTMRSADAMAAGKPGARLYTGKQAVDFWSALLFRNPYSGSAVAPNTFLQRLLSGTDGEWQTKEKSDTEHERLPF